ncbi:M14 family zinc carboxypeptidase [Lacihabitans lacunae]|uniref:M14 family zinc carboxypeptidase n=1 Tax=Lacihabitans lacunae TaxID=1028214 RepID=A0ABV7YVM5_9BACT
MKIIKTLFFISIFFATNTYAQGLLSPDKFFGEPTGSKFHFHHQLISYVEHVAANKPENVKILPLGKTTEGRPQLIVAIGSPENIKNLESIRKANLANIGMGDGTPNSNIPVIAMLSYNVHGNESVSSECMVKVIYEMAAGQSDLSKSVLKNTVVLIDPCVNPDGFDRYSTWYNRYIGSSPDLHGASVEHHEPWPGGRFNHYLFDLNRDIAWQTQKETQQRISFYNSWMPQLHADFHEMGPNSTYYFAPSAKPFHEDINTYQRDFQVMLGEYNKKNFDDKGWLYYTKENYDLLYPSYGDTYPTYNGAIGMTFEQAGGGPAGLAFKRQDGDTLTLTDRIAHSYSTSLGTLKAISEKSEETKKAFAKYFNDAQSKGYGKYKSYILKYAGNEAKINALTDQLDRLQIKYGYAGKKSTGFGFNYQANKEDNFSIDEKDLIISTFQPKGVFTKILFEPKTVLEDSNTYDITAWSLPYAFDIEAYATSAKLTGDEAKPTGTRISEVTAGKKVFAFASEINSFEESKFLASLLKEKIKVRVQENAFKAEGKNFKRGTLLITRKGNENLGANFETKVVEIAKMFNINLTPMYSGLVESGSDVGAGSVDVVNAPKVGLLMGAGITPTAVGDVWHYFDQQLKYPVTLIDGSYFSSVDLWSFDVLILPNGNYGKIISDTKEINRWISDGGRLILLESANDFFAGKDGFNLISKTKDKKNTQGIYGDRERNAISDQIPGAIFKINLDNTHPLAYGYSGSSYFMIKNKIDFDYLKNGWNVGKLGDHMSGFVGKNLITTMKDLPVFSVQDLGKGKVIYMIESPLFRAFWNSGKLMFANATFLVK